GEAAGGECEQQSRNEDEDRDQKAGCAGASHRESLDHDPIELNRIMISFPCLSVILLGKPVSTFPESCCITPSPPAHGRDRNPMVSRDRTERRNRESTHGCLP